LKVVVCASDTYLGSAESKLLNIPLFSWLKKKNKNSNNFYDCTLRTVVVEDFFPVVSYEIG